MAERYGDEFVAALPEVDAVWASPAKVRSPRWCWAAPQAGGPARPPGAAPPGADRSVGLREGRRRLRPRLCVLRHPVVPGKAAFPDAGVDPDAEARGLVAGGAREIVLVAQDLASYGRDAGEPGSLAPLLTSPRGAWPATASPGSGSSTSTRRRSANR